MYPVEKNKQYTGIVEDINFEGIGVIKMNGFPIFVENTLPGEEIEFLVIKVLKKYAIGKCISIIQASNQRCEVLDPKGTWTGTMPLQHMNYDAQLLLKQNQVKNVMKKIAKLKVNVAKTLGCDQVVAYRNKAQIPLRMINGKLETGFFRKHSHTLIPIEDFVIQDKKIDSTIIAVRDILREFHIQGYNEIQHTGDIRHIIVRRGYFTKQIQITLVILHENIPHLNEIIERIKKLDEVRSIVLNIHPNATNVIVGKNTRVVFGKDEIEDKILGKSFKISSLSFYQVNPIQTEKLYQLAIELADLKKDDIVIDAYCGIGTIGICLADRVKKVYGVEIVEDAIVMAIKNAALNNLDNLEFEAGDAEKVMEKWKSIQPNVIIVDPPRKGLSNSFILSCVKMNPEKIVYISCNPATLARDLAIFETYDYICDTVYPVDMFPQTDHVECVVLLERKYVGYRKCADK